MAPAFRRYNKLFTHLVTVLELIYGPVNSLAMKACVSLGDVE